MELQKEIFGPEFLSNSDESRSILDENPDGEIPGADPIDGSIPAFP